jgi:3-oxoacyl-[acyl-carrier protein] reductase
VTATPPVPAAPSAPAAASPASGPGDGHQLLAGKTVLVTAAAGTGIGSAAALRCAAEGATVAISDRHERRLAEAARTLGQQTGKPPLAIPCDGTDQAQVDHLINTVAAELGRIDVLINNVGLGGQASILDMTDEQWNSVLDVTLTATFRATRAALRHMVPRRRGVIVNNASVLGWRAQAGQAHYAAAKAGVMALTRCAAMDVAEYGIRINAVSPSIAMHPFLAKVSAEQTLAELVSREAFGRAAEPWEVANVMVFLASDYSSYMTGEVVSVSSQHP